MFLWAKGRTRTGVARDATRGLLLFRIGLLVAALAVAGGTACSKVGDWAQQKAGVSKSEYLQAVNPICSGLNQRIQALGQPSSSIKEQAQLALEVNEMTRSTVIRIRALPAPDTDAVMLDALYERTLATLRVADRSARALERGNEVTANRAFTRALGQITEINRTLAEYGLTECAQ
jgi:hypothetical protein